MTEHEKSLQRSRLEDMHMQMRTGLTKDIKLNAACGIIAELKGMNYVKGKAQKQFIPIASRLYKEFIKEFDKEKN